MTSPWPDVDPSSVEARPTERTIHGVVIRDDYAWLRAGNWRDVLREPTALSADIRAVLEAENAYAAAHLEPSAELVDDLVVEMRGRMKEDDASVPLEDGPWLYYSRHRESGQQPLFCRKASEHDVEHDLLGGRRRGRPARRCPEHVVGGNMSLQRELVEQRRLIDRRSPIIADSPAKREE